ASLYGLILAFATMFIYAPFDFTGWGPYLIVFLIGLIIFGIFALIYNNHALYLFYSYLGAIIFSFYTIYDVQMIIGGKKFQIKESEYVLATLELYLDIINLFLNIIGITGSKN
ncbi:hypothetical protein MXB_1125, partial [Myxobolus squamalis]